MHTKATIDAFPIAMTLLFDASQCFTQEFLKYFKSIFVRYGQKQMAINIMANYNVIPDNYHCNSKVHENVWFAFQNISFENIDCVIAHMRVNIFVNHPLWNLAFKVVQKIYTCLEEEYKSTNNGELKEQKKMCMNQVKHVIELLRYYRKNVNPMDLQKCQYFNHLPIVEYIKFAISVIKQTTPRISSRISIQQSILEKKQAEMTARLRYKTVKMCCNDGGRVNKGIVKKLRRSPNNGFPMLPGVISLVIIEYVHFYFYSINIYGHRVHLTQPTCCCTFGSKKYELLLK
jgi:hypothetical protein